MVLPTRFFERNACTNHIDDIRAIIQRFNKRVRDSSSHLKSEDLIQ